MATNNIETLGKYAGEIYIGAYDSSIPSLENNSAVDVTSYIDSNVDFVKMGGVVDIQRSHDSTANVIEVETDDEGTIYRATEPEVTFSADWYKTGDFEAVAEIVNVDIETVDGTLTTVTDEQLSTSGADQYESFVLEKKNADGTAVTVNDVTADGTSLTEGTDYEVQVNEDGYTELLFIVSQTGTILADYDYTPAESKYMSTEIKTQEIPTLVAKIVSADDDGNINREYLIDAGFEGELIQAYIDPSRAGDLTGSSLEFTANKRGAYIFNAQRGIN